MELLGSIDPARPLVVVAVHLGAEYLHTDLPVLVTGVGKVAATRSLMAAVAPLHQQARPSAIVNVGTAGALRPGLDGTHLVGRVIQHDIDGAAIAKLIGVDPAPPLHLGDGLVLATGDQFISHDARRDELAQRAHLVDMEGYAIAEAARTLDLPVALVKHVSDDAGSEALTSWVESVAACSATLGAWLTENAHIRGFQCTTGS